jgi:hypothetical protein
MRRGTGSIKNHRLGNGAGTYRTTDPSTERIASLASMTMARQSPGLVFPLLSDIPTSFSHTEGTDSALGLARSLATLGLGSPELWQRENGNPSLFSRNSINEWLGELGASKLNGIVDVAFAIVDDLQGTVPENKGHLFVLLETSDGCGLLTIGKQLDLLEEVQAGLGRAFYIVLLMTLRSWVDVYGAYAAEYYVERWKESVEMDIEGDLTEQSFDDYCRDHEIIFPDIAAATPACVRDISITKKGRDLKRSIALLQEHRHGKYGDVIEPVLAMVSLGKPMKGMDPQLLGEIFEDGPLPNWVIAFDTHDPISQAFDEEGQHMNEVLHAPTWIASFDPTNVGEVRSVLAHVQSFLAINQQLAKLSRSMKKGQSSASTSRPEYNDELRAA